MRRFVAILAMVMIGVSASAQQKVKNIIFMIGDGMGIAAVTAAQMHNNGQPLAMQRGTAGGFITTYPANGRVTDSAAAATALACGIKTKNGMIGVDPQGNTVESIREKAQKAGMATGVIDTHSVTDATPGGFVVHVSSRKNAEDIAAQYVDSGINLFIGGGMKYFTGRSDGRDLVKEMEAKGYKMTGSLDDVLSYNGTKLGALLAGGVLKSVAEGRGDMLSEASAKSYELLKAASPKGFFIMVEGSMIDTYAHANDIDQVVGETLDFDRAVARAFDFADRNPGTLVVVTADHETGGLALAGAQNDAEQHSITPGVKYIFATKGHTCTMVPVFAYGTGADSFSGVKDNTDLPKIIAKLLGLK